MQLSKEDMGIGELEQELEETEERNEKWIEGKDTGCSGVES